jgi:hypothetical protein
VGYANRSLGSLVQPVENPYGALPFLSAWQGLHEVSGHLVTAP